MAQATSYNTVGNRENLTDILTIVDPEKTPKLSSFSKRQGQSNIFQEWQFDKLSAVRISGVPEGQDIQAFKNQVQDRARVGNYTQIFQEPWAVSRLQAASNPAGVSSEVANSKDKAIRNVKRYIEAAIGSDNEMQADTGSVGYKFRALGKWAQSTAQAVNPVPAAYLTPSAAIDTTATASLAESNFNDVFQAVYQAGGDEVTGTLYAGPALKRAISGFQRATGSSGTTKTYQVTQDATEKRITLAVSFYDGDFHTVAIVPDLFNGVLDGADPSVTTSQQKARGYFIPSGVAWLSYMIGLESSELEDQGGGRRGFVEAALTLGIKSPRAIGKFAATS
jgi:hypothetical protein